MKFIIISLCVEHTFWDDVDDDGYNSSDCLWMGMKWAKQRRKIGKPITTRVEVKLNKSNQSTENSKSFWFHRKKKRQRQKRPSNDLKSKWSGFSASLAIDHTQSHHNRSTSSSISRFYYWFKDLMFDDDEIIHNLKNSSIIGQHNSLSIERFCFRSEKA